MQTRSENRGKARREKREGTLSIIEKEGVGGGSKANTVLGKVMLTDTVISKALQTPQPAKQAGSRAQAGDERWDRGPWARAHDKGQHAIARLTLEGSLQGCLAVYTSQRSQDLGLSHIPEMPLPSCARDLKPPFPYLSKRWKPAVIALLWELGKPHGRRCSPRAWCTDESNYYQAWVGVISGGGNFPRRGYGGFDFGFPSRTWAL